MKKKKEHLAILAYITCESRYLNRMMKTNYTFGYSSLIWKNRYPNRIIKNNNTFGYSSQYHIWINRYLNRMMKKKKKTFRYSSLYYIWVDISEQGDEITNMSSWDFLKALLVFKHLILPFGLNKSQTAIAWILAILRIINPSIGSIMNQFLNLNF